MKKTIKKITKKLTTKTNKKTQQEPMEKIFVFPNKTERKVLDKFQQGDVQAYPFEDTKLPKGSKRISTGKEIVLVNSTNPHVLKGPFTEYEYDSIKLIQLSGKGVMQHAQHKDIELEKGLYAITQPVEVGVFDDMVKPVVD